MGRKILYLYLPYNFIIFLVMEFLLLVLLMVNFLLALLIFWCDFIISIVDAALLLLLRL